MNTRPRVQIDLQQVEELASRGLTMEQIAAALGICDRTLYRKKGTMSDLSEAIKRGKAKGVATVSNALFERAVQGDVKAQMFYLERRGGWYNEGKLEVSGMPPVQIVLDGKLPPDDADPEEN